MEKQEIFNLFLSKPNAMDFYKEFQKMVWEWQKNGEVVSPNEKKNS